ncbi:MAG: peptidase S8 [Alphaproteobacteria bacterium]|nr:peptidase S8 [Alphaproteobacteria bacterium]
MRFRRAFRRYFVSVSALVLVSGAAMGQGLGGLGGLGNGIGSGIGGLPPVLNGPLGQVNRTLGTAAGTVRRSVDSVGRRAQPPANLFEADIAGARIVKSEVLAVSPSEESLAIARGLNFDVLRQQDLGALDLRVLVLRPPAGMSTTEALSRLRMADPNGVYDYNHIYGPSGQAGAGEIANGATRAVSVKISDGEGLAIGLVDGGVDRTHPALLGAKIIAANLVGKGASPPSAHGTALASLLVGDGRNVTGALPRAQLYVADVFGGKAEGGSADDIVRGLAWVAGKGPAIINVSLTGPANRSLEAVVRALIARGHIVVAAVGNDGPAASVKYPAAYPGVIAVTSVDSAKTIQVDANRGPEIAFAALGVGVSVAALDKNYASATGTSFAAPLVAARFALEVRAPDAGAAERAKAAPEREALDLGEKGRDSVFGFGLLGRKPNAAESVSFQPR